MPDLPELLRRFWGIDDAGIHPLGGGMNSHTWLVEHQGSAYVAKRVPPDQLAAFAAGCQIATTLADAGVVTGRPVATRDGRLLVSDPPLALLERVPGRELDGESDEEQRWIADTLAAVHLAGGPEPGLRTTQFATDWLSPRLPGVKSHPWLVLAIEQVRAETDDLALTWSVLHADPSPEAFVHDDRTGATALIDWAGARRGPVLYDVASAVMYLGGRQRALGFLRAYRRHGPVADGELQRLDAFRRFRWAVQGVYFAGRIANSDLTGIADQAGNEKGLTDARRGLAQLGLGRPR